MYIYSMCVCVSVCLCISLLLRMFVLCYISLILVSVCYCYELKCVPSPPTRYVEVLSSSPQNVSLLRNRVVMDVIS